MTLFDSLNRPFKGIRTYADVSAIPGGFWKDARNIRTDTGAIAVRAGQTQIVDNSGLSGTCVGSCLVEYGANTYLLTALEISGSVRIYYNLYNGSSWGSAAEITAASGFFGNTRMATPSSGFVTFTKVYSTTDGLCVVVQDGTSSPRVIKMSAIAAGNMRVISEVPAPQELGGLSPSFGSTSSLSIHTNTGTTANGAGTFDCTSSGTPKLLTFTTGAGAMVDGDTTQVTGLGSMDLGDARQVFFIGEISDEAILDSIKIELKCANYDVTIHNPEGGLDSVVSVETNTPGLRVYAFPLGEYSPSERVPGGGGPGVCGGFKFTLTNTNCPINQTFIIRAICTGGRVPGFAEYSESWYCSSSMTESPEVVMKTPVYGATATEMFNGVATALPDNFKLPMSDALYYRVVVPYLAGDQDIVDSGVDYTNIYRRDPGEENRTFVASKQTAEYSGGWAYTGSFTVNAQKGYHADTVAPEDKVYERIAPDAFNEPVPIGQAALWASSRHYVGTYKASSSEPKSVIKVSEQDDPFRFASIPREDLSTSAFLAQLNGEEVVVTFQSVSSSIIGSSVVYCFTNRGMYSVDGTIIRRISSIGALATHSVAENQNRIFWVDQNLSVRKSDGAIRDLSRLRIDDILLGATNTDKLQGVFHRDRYYLAYSGGVLVWSDLMNDWESRDTPAVQPKMFIPWRVGNSAKLYFTSSDGSLYEYESGANDAGTAINLVAQIPIEHGRDYDRMTVGRPNIVCSDKDSTTLNVTITTANPARSNAGTINLDSGAGETVTWREAKKSGAMMSSSGVYHDVKFDVNVQYPFVIRGIVMKELKHGAGVGRDS